MKKVETKIITCDNCGKSLITHSPSPATYVLQLSAINVNINDTGMQYSVIIHPPIDEDKHFCNKQCLKEWI